MGKKVLANLLSLKKKPETNEGGKENDTLELGKGWGREAGRG